jgi:carotenoid cleavage dioxygenase
VTRQSADPTEVELPRIDPRRQGLPYRYAYAPGGNYGGPDGSVAPPNAITKFDFEGSPTVHMLGPGQQPGELTFVPALGSDVEDEGWLIGYVYDEAAALSHLAIFDATEITAGAVARVEFGRRVPFGFHGTFVRT